MATILIIDTSHPDHADRQGLLKECGHRVIEAEQGSDVQELLRSHSPDLVLMSKSECPEMPTQKHTLCMSSTNGLQRTVKRKMPSDLLTVIPGMP